MAVDAGVEKSQFWWKTAGYIAWFTADTAAAAGLSLRVLAISLIGYAVSGSTLAAGWLGTASMIAQQVLSAFGGTFVDRHDRKLLIIINAIVGLLAWLSVALLIALNDLSFPVLLVIAVVTSAINGFLSSATEAMLKSIIDIRNYPKARSLNEGRDATIAMAGSPIGGFLYSLYPWLPFVISACMYAISGVAATTIHTAASRSQENIEQVDRQNRSSFMQDFVAGWAWSLHKRRLVIILAVAALINFGVNGVQYAIQLWLVSGNTHATLIGLISAGISLATLVGSVIAGKLSDKVPVGTTVCIAFLFICVCAVPMVFTDTYWMVLLSNSLMGIPFPIINAMLLGFVFAKAPVNMQGRIATTLTVPAQALSSCCSAVAGALLPLLGFQQTVLLFLLVLIASCVLVVCSPSIRSIPSSKTWAQTTL